MGRRHMRTKELPGPGHLPWWQPSSGSAHSPGLWARLCRMGSLVCISLAINLWEKPRLAVVVKLKPQYMWHRTDCVTMCVLSWLYVVPQHPGPL